MCVCVIFEKRDMFCLHQRVFRQRFLLVTRTDAFGGLSCAGMCENVCVFICAHAPPPTTCVRFIMSVFVCLLARPYVCSLTVHVSFSICLFECIRMCGLRVCVCVCACVCARVWECVCVCVSVCECVCVHSQAEHTVYLRLERAEKKHTSIEASSVLSVTICWFPNQTLWFNEFPVQDVGWEACLLLWLHTASCDAFSYIWHTHTHTYTPTHTIYKVLMRNGPTLWCRGTVI